MFLCFGFSIYPFGTPVTSLPYPLYPRPPTMFDLLLPTTTSPFSRLSSFPRHHLYDDPFFTSSPLSISYRPSLESEQQSDLIHRRLNQLKHEQQRLEQQLRESSRSSSLRSSLLPSSPSSPKTYSYAQQRSQSSVTDKEGRTTSEVKEGVHEEKNGQVTKDEHTYYRVHPDGKVEQLVGHPGQTVSRGFSRGSRRGSSRNSSRTSNKSSKSSRTSSSSSSSSSPKRTVSTNELIRALSHSKAPKAPSKRGAFSKKRKNTLRKFSSKRKTV